MNMKQAIAAVLVFGTLTGSAFAGPRFHGGQHGRGGFDGQRWEQQGHNSGYLINHHKEMRQHSRTNWTQPHQRGRGRNPVFTPGRGPKPGERGGHGGHGPKRPMPPRGGRGPRKHGWR